VTQQLDHEEVYTPGTLPRARRSVSAGEVAGRRVVTVLLLVVPVVWALHRAVPGGAALVNVGGVPLVGDLFASAFDPALSRDFLMLTLDAAVITLVYAAIGTVGALVIGTIGGWVLSDVTWGRTPPRPVRLLRLALRGILVATRSIHELVWALLFVSVLGLDPLVAVLAIAVPFGAQTAKVFAETLDGVSPRQLDALRGAGARPASALFYGLVPAATPLLLSYSFCRFECAVRSTVLLGVAGVGGLGQELVVSLQSRNWDEVWTLIWALLLLSAVIDLWSSLVRRDAAVVSCSEWSGGQARRRPGRNGGTARWARWSAVLVLPAVALAWVTSGVSLTGLTSPRARELTGRLFDDLWPPALPGDGWSVLAGAMLDTVAMAVLAMAVAVLVTVLVAPWAARPRADASSSVSGRRGAPVRFVLWFLARLVLLVLRSVPPTVWAVIALLALFPGVLPGALALGLYTGGILGRLVAEAWESMDTRARDALQQAGVRRPIAALASMMPPSAHHLLTYTLYRFEICVRDTAVVGVVGAAGLGRLLGESLAAFRFPVVTTLLLGFFTLNLAAELVGRQLRKALRP